MSSRSKKVTIIGLISLFVIAYLAIMYSLTISQPGPKYEPNNLSVEQLALQEQLRLERQDRMAEIQEVTLPDNSTIYLDPVGESSGMYFTTAPTGYNDPLYLSPSDKDMIAQLQLLETAFGFMTVNKYQVILDALTIGIYTGLILGLISGFCGITTSNHKNSLVIGVVLGTLFSLFITGFITVDYGLSYAIPASALTILGNIVIFSIVYPVTCLIVKCWPKEEVEQTMIRT